MLVLGRVPEGVAAVLPARDDHREFGDEVDARFGDRGLLADRLPRGFALRAAIADPHLALAVIAEAPGLEDERAVPSSRDRGFDIVERRDLAPRRDARAACPR